jgi:hypothetical protein
MRRILVVVLSAAAVVVVAALASGLGRHDGPEHAAAAPARALERPVQGPLAGTASCAGRSCHGGIEASDRSAISLLNEYTTWVTLDPHARAFAVLEGDKSKAIAQRLGIGPAHESQRCLGCHTTPDAARQPENPDAARFVKYERRLGVGCESCHGNARDWLDEHLTQAWKSSDKKMAGMVPVADATVLAQRCAGCHVGAPPEDGIERDVNHDLIAAGHPRLTFEFSSYFANLPVHWRPKQFPDEARRWAIGQAVAAEVALELLKHRAESAGAPWPEFSEYDCFGCHHELTPQTWRQNRKPGGRRLGSLVWGSWYLPVPAALGDAPMPELCGLACTMEKPLAPRDAVRKQIPPALAKLGKLKDKVAGWQMNAGQARGMMESLLADPRLTQEASWDIAEQTYLGLLALNRVAKDPAWQERLGALRDDRAFKTGWNSPPHEFVPSIFVEKLRGAGRQ